MMKPFTWRVCTLIAPLLGAACGGRADGAEAARVGDAVPTPEANVTEVQHYGWESLADSGRKLSPEERRVSGGILGRVDAVVEGPDGAVYVLDGSYKKIVVFNRDRSLRRVILGGYGEGPGEFLQPRDMALMGERIFVIDSRQRRLTVLDTAGRVRGTKALGSIRLPYRLKSAGGRLYVLGWYRRDGRAVSVLDTSGVLMDSAIAVSSRLADFADNGESGDIAVLRDGEVVFAWPWVGEWSRLSDGRTRGREIAPRAEAGVYKNPAGTEVSYTTRGVKGVGQLADSTLVFFYSVRSVDPEGKPVYTWHLLFTDANNGSERGRFTITTGLGGTAFAAAASATDFFMARGDPFPRVVRYRVQSYDR